MNYIKRDMESLVKDLNNEYACILITGPRQVGKSTMLEHIDGNRTKVTPVSYTHLTLPTNSLV